MHSESAARTDPAESTVVEALRARDEQAFADLVVKHGGAMRRVAGAITHDVVLAEEAVQETWLAVIRGIGAFEQRSSLKTWVFRILVNRARTIGAREARTRGQETPPTPAAGTDDLPDSRFQHPAAPGHWTSPLADWGRSPEDDLLSGELRSVIASAITALAPSQREVITLRDVEGWDASEVCNVLGLTEVNQRVLLHRARTRVRSALETYYTQSEGGADGR